MFMIFWDVRTRLQDGEKSTYVDGVSGLSGIVLHMNQVKDLRESFILSGLRHWFPTCQELYRKRLRLPCKCYRIFYDDRNEWCALYTWEKKKEFYAINVFWKIELEKFTNSKSGTKLSVLWNLPVRSYGLQWLLERSLHNNLLCDENILWHQVTNAYHILRFPRKKAWATIKEIDTV
jgi:hypothetical protein